MKKVTLWLAHTLHLFSLRASPGYSIVLKLISFIIELKDFTFLKGFLTFLKGPKILNFNIGIYH